MKMKLIWKMDPELSYFAYCPKDEREPVLVEPFTIDENGRRIRKKPERTADKPET